MRVLAVAFINCRFIGCSLNAAKINHTAFRSVVFDSCQIKDVNFAMCDKLLFNIRFVDCTLDFSKFYTLKIKGTHFTNCSLIAVDFMSADLTNATFENCDLYRSVFHKANAGKANFVTSRNYTIDPENTTLKKARFSKDGVPGLLTKYDLAIV